MNVVSTLHGHEIALARALRNKSSLMVQVGHGERALAKLIRHWTLADLIIVLADEVDLGQVTLILFNTLLSILLEHVIVVLQLGVLTLR